MAPIPLTKEELEVQAKFDLIKRKRHELQQVRAASAPTTASAPVKKRPSAVVAVGDIEAARKVLESEAKKPKLEKKEVMVRPLEDDLDKRREVKPFVSVFSGGAGGARRDYRNRFVSANRPPAVPRKQRFGFDEMSMYKSTSIQVSGDKLTEDLLINHFGECGEMELVKVDATGCRGFVTFKKADHATKAIDITMLDDQPVKVIQIDPEAIQAADFSKQALSSPWASLAAGVAVHKREERRIPRQYGEPISLSYDEPLEDI